MGGNGGETYVRRVRMHFLCMSTNAVLPALIAATAALGGVTVGALVEPLRLGAARRARVRDDRAARCARLVEAAMDSRTWLLALNAAHRRGLTGTDLEEWMTPVRNARNELRQAVALLHLSGPEKLVEAAQALREAEQRLRVQRFTVEDGKPYDGDRAPAPVAEAANALEEAVHAFASLARRYAG